MNKKEHIEQQIFCMEMFISLYEEQIRFYKARLQHRKYIMDKLIKKLEKL